MCRDGLYLGGEYALAGREEQTDEYNGLDIVSTTIVKRVQSCSFSDLHNSEKAPSKAKTV